LKNFPCAGRPLRILTAFAAAGAVACITSQMEPVPTFGAAVIGFINGIMNVRSAFMTDLNMFYAALEND
jgi:hypothetical protein